MPKSYQELKRERDRLQQMLDENSDLKEHRTYKSVERKLHDVKSQIKGIFREEYNKRTNG